MTRKANNQQVEGFWWRGDEGPALYNLADLFGNNQPVELDLGCGRGLFVFNQARLRPGVNFIGVDWSRTYSRLGAARVARHGLTNARFICDDAWKLFERFPPQSFAAIHISFPDPWWKRRHRKRRLVQSELIPFLEKLLVPSGDLLLATDVEEYFRVMIKTMSQAQRLVRQPDPQPTAGSDDLDFLSHFERKYRRAGRPIFRAHYSLPDASSFDPPESASIG